MPKVLPTCKTILVVLSPFVYSTEITGAKITFTFSISLTSHPFIILFHSTVDHFYGGIVLLNEWVKKLGGSALTRGKYLEKVINRNQITRA